MKELLTLSLAEISQKLHRREVSAVELTEAMLTHISEVEPKVQAFITPTPELALEMARQAQARLDAGERTPLLGVPIGLKDNLCTADVRTTCASRILHNFVPPYDATVVKRLREQGAVFVGKLNMDEFAMGSSTEFSAFHPTRNPWDLERVPGGSSGGSAAAVAAHMAYATLGSDTGGSIRQPAAFCGVVGLKPTYGRVSRYGLVAYASSLDQIGPITKTVEDCAMMLNAIAGYDPHDATSVNLTTPDYRDALIDDIRGIRLGIPKEFLAQGVQPEVAETVHKAIGLLESVGAEVQEVSLPMAEQSLAIYYILAPAECSSNLARYDGVRYGLRVGAEKGHIGMMEATRAAGFGKEVVQRIIIGTYALSSGYYDAFYLKAQKGRTLLRQQFDAVFAQVDALVCPTTPTPAFKIGELVDDPLAMKLADVLTIPVNLAGLPGLSVPCGFVNDLPVGLQIIGKPFDEMTVLRIGYVWEQLACLQDRLRTPRALQPSQA
ncbi:MAG: Asp-tRNA(Asn)/Glu-tRNA(Gln) amidotransferase GatCAB subunit A [Armatimonadetes bacterium JP3_11]|nr:MAG: Asp-tRNA(Asn)/Glu-tRNA(Gln) amidotransferase GatCAB subunit A [Armatimonadetes bacterium CP1_7O]OYT74924.1 MAG: Asp-tRNA(Asn)/Glu-tRNA(Gln) amidotransferase GatCAB subunit A [Armatimonadetes bacterium JP3_11]